MQKSIPAVFVRGGTSRALVFHRDDLPAAHPPRDCAAWNPILLAALGSPDSHGRQLDGMGGGTSSLSKIAVIGPSSRPDADVDYTFGQVAIGEALVGYRGNCGNISSAVGPFAVDEGLVKAAGDTAVVRIHNTNTGKIIVANFPLDNGKAAVEGDFILQGVAGSGARIKLTFLDPGGAVTGQFLPTGNACDELDLPDIGRLEVSLVDAANPTVFVAAEALKLGGSETPESLTRDIRMMALFEELRIKAALAMGVIATEAEGRSKVKNLPLVSILSPSSDPDSDIVTRMVSAGQPHKATPLTGAMCLAIAARLPGSLPHRIAGRTEGDLRIAHPSGVLPVTARVSFTGGKFRADEAVVYRTARRLMEGRVLIPASRF